MFSRKSREQKARNFLEHRKRGAEAALAEARLAIDLDWSNGGNDDTFIRKLKETVDGSLNALKTEIEGATAPEQLDSIQGRIAQCSSKRAYGLDAPRIQTEADACIREMRTWGVPQRYFDEHLRPLQEAVRVALTEACRPGNAAGCSASMRRAQSTLDAIFDEYAYWDSYTERYVHRSLTPMVRALGVAGLLSLVAALVSGFVLHQHLVAVFSAGFGGTCVSILLKQEPLAVYGDSIKALIWSVGRLLTGVLATVIGMGLLASGLISVGFTVNPTDSSGSLVPIHVILGACLESGSDKANVASVAATSRSDAATADAGVAPLDADGSDAGAPAPTAGVLRQAPAPLPCPRRACSNTALLLLLGFAILFGFSERVFARILAQFEDKAGSAPQSNTSSTTVISRGPEPPVAGGGALVPADEQKPDVPAGQPTPTPAPGQPTAAPSQPTAASAASDPTVPAQPPSSGGTPPPSKPFGT
jgi:hypothetical protein